MTEAEEKLRALVQRTKNAKHPPAADEIDVIIAEALDVEQVLDMLDRTREELRERTDTAYAIIYDSWCYESQGWKDDSYEIFSTPEEAIQAFRETYAQRPGEVAQPRLVAILEPIPGHWNITSNTPSTYLEDH